MQAYNPVETFLQEAEELLAEIEQSALLLDSEEGTGETINHLFRAFHTIKGSGAMCGLDAVAGFTHHLENLLDRVRSGAIPVSPALAGLVLKARDHIKILLGAEQGGAAAPAGSSEKLIAAIEEFAHSGTSAIESEAVAPVQRIEKAEERGTGEWSIRFRPHPTLLACGGNPVSLLRELRDLGSCEVTAHSDEVPGLDDYQPDVCYLWWTIGLRSACDENAIRDVFIFVEDNGTLEIERINSAAVEEQPGEIVSPTSSGAGASVAVGDGAATGAGVATGDVVASGASVATGAGLATGDGAVTGASVATGDGLATGAGLATGDGAAAGGLPQPAAAPPRVLAREATVRVPSNRLDRLVNLVGELVMNQSRLAQAASHSGLPEFTNPVQELERLVSELRDNVLGIRMLPIGSIFGRFRRLVHDLSAELGKEVELVTEGAETELDKSILDQLGEPLVHCLRNCIDHGIESPSEREAKGKPRYGTIRLSATHTGSDVVVSIQDDGRGIDRAAVRAKAVDKQLIAPSANLSDQELFNLVLLPGFSTAKQVTSVSGRGVGMDVVKRQIDALRGSLSLASKEGKGVRVSITLPLTLAIIEGLLVEIGTDQFIVPMSTVTENVELLSAQRACHNGRNLIAVRGEPIPYIDLRSAFQVPGEAPAIEKVVIVRHEDNRVGLVVDRVLGTHQTVIQSLGRFFKEIKVVSGATIMGDGRVALIIDTAAAVRLVDRECRESAAGTWVGAEPALAC
jgi:two-component system chemotaxis sensor kinase CheA